MDLGLAGTRALVTGSYRGTGSAIAATLAAEGATVYVHGFEAGQPDEVVEGIVAAGGSAVGVVGALDTADAAHALLAACGEPLDIVVCNYGAAAGGRWPTASDDDWIEAYETNVMSAVRLVRAALPTMTTSGWGRIVLLGTVGTARPAAVRPQYYAAKSALPGLTVSLAQEMAGTGVTVNLVSPGIIATAEVMDRLQGRSVEEVFGIAPLTGRPATPAEVADLVAFVCSRRADSITGANLHIDGGSAQTVTP